MPCREGAWLFLLTRWGFPPGEPLRYHHNPHFDIDEGTRPLGAALLSETAMRFLAAAGEA
jgi:hypothetical protein